MEREGLTLAISRAERERIETQARQHGYDSAQSYLLSLVEADSPNDEVDAYFNHEPEAAFRQAWQEAMTGQTHSVSTLWDNLDDE